MQNSNIVQTEELVVAPPRPRVNKAHRILVVEDDMALRDFSKEVLVWSGYEVVTAEHGEAGWEALRANSYDLMITDNNMPKLSGVELVKKVRSARMTLPVIMASGFMPKEELRQNPWLQLAATLEKPFTTDELLETVKEVLRTADSAGVRRGEA